MQNQLASPASCMHPMHGTLHNRLELRHAAQRLEVVIRLGAVQRRRLFRGDELEQPQRVCSRAAACRSARCVVPHRAALGAAAELPGGLQRRAVRLPCAIRKLRCPLRRAQSTCTARKARQAQRMQARSMPGAFILEQGMCETSFSWCTYRAGSQRLLTNLGLVDRRERKRSTLLLATCDHVCSEMQEGYLAEQVMPHRGAACWPHRTVCEDASRPSSGGT